MDANDLPRVTVVVPCFNRERTVRAAVESVLTQDYPNFDVIAVDDHSTDRTLDVLRAISDPRLSVLHNDGPKGAAGARNAGVAKVTSPFVAFQDSDDLWYRGKLTKQMSRIAGGGFVAVYCAMDCYEEGKRLVRVPSDIGGKLEGDLLEPLLTDSLISTQTVIMRTDIFLKVGGMDPDVRSLDDWEMMIRVAQEGLIAYVDAVLVEQHMSANSITRSAQNRVNAQIQILEKHRSLWANYPEALARHHNRISGGLMQLRRFQEARAHAFAAVRLKPWNWRYRLKALVLDLLTAS